MKYTLYHIKGVKWGMTDNLIRRLKAQGLGVADCCEFEYYDDIKIASQRELELQTQYGYKEDTMSYDKFIDGKRQSKGGSISGPKNVRIMHQKTPKHIYSDNGKLVTSRPQWKEIARKGGKKIGRQNGLLVTSRPEWKYTASMGGKAAASNKETFMGGYLTCPHCNKTMNKGNYNRWHGDKCRKKK